ncbi:hypothetical protein Nepgr_005481 [Nepenthes gracilis]|uniref:Cytochrome c oxidase subunit Vb n=1 Tax=Nepenthes gracilis TaxID=150966 RepID=A0AAD3XGH3_NEPGR|nr:hypothetical protein Nepgr_005481 [Nepenthes gracilis]
MWRRVVSSRLHALVFSNSRRSASKLASASVAFSVDHLLTTARRTGFLLLFSSSFHRQFSSESENLVSKPKKRVEDIIPIATGHEREELEADFEGRNILEINYPVGPFGTKEAPAVVKSYYNKRIVGCPGGKDEDEHDVIWFWLEKDKPCKCPVCSQYFVLEVVGPGGPPDGHEAETSSSKQPPPNLPVENVSVAGELKSS